jgi:hypothetical protein
MFSVESVSIYVMSQVSASFQLIYFLGLLSFMEMEISEWSGMGCV